jgi:hypothetical protein
VVVKGNHCRAWVELNLPRVKHDANVRRGPTAEDSYECDEGGAADVAVTALAVVRSV